LRLQHPDLHPIAPFPGKTSRGRLVEDGEEGSVDEVVDKKLLAVFAEKAADPYVSVLLPRARDILIGQIRVLTNQASRMPFQSARKVFVIFHADRMNVNAQNAFLKVLEEPPADTHLLLTSEREGALLETIQSRCQHIAFQPLSETDIEDALQTRHPELGEAAPLVSRLAGGNLRQALELSEMDWNALQDLAVSYLAECARLDPLELEAYHTKLLSSDFGGPPVSLGTLQLFLRDVALIKAARHARQDPQPLLVLRSFRKRAEKLLEVFPSADPDRAVQAVQTARDYLDRGYTPSSVLTALSFRLHRALGPQGKSRRAA
jgi:DNA polymerase-3 subunit delta'